MEWRNEEFDLGGVNHLALVCSDMKRTVEFYTQVLGMRLIKTLDLPNGQGQHFFFDMGGGNALAFFWFPDAPDAVPGVSAPVTVPGIGEWTSAVGSMNHVAFNVPEERFLEYRAKLKAKGIRVSPIMDHDDSEFGVARELHPGVFVRSYYFQDPDGILLEFACWRRVMGQPGDVRHEPKTAADRTGVPGLALAVPDPRPGVAGRGPPRRDRAVRPAGRGADLCQPGRGGGSLGGRVRRGRESLPATSCRSSPGTRPAGSRPCSA